jgi:acetyl esterase/lipase
VYKKVGGTALLLEIFEPNGLKPGDRRPAFITIHGGGWTSGGPRAMYTWADHCRQLGLVAISVQYRLYKPKTEHTVINCVEDARSAVRYIRAHAAELGIDPQKLVLNGASAGGHLAVATELLPFDDLHDDLSVSCQPNALVLFSPVIDTSTEGYGNAKVGPNWRELSPADNVHPHMPPTITFHGTGDTTTPFKGAKKFQEAMLAAGNRSELVVVDSAEHTYMFKHENWRQETRQKLDAFLAANGMLPDKAL